MQPKFSGYRIAIATTLYMFFAMGMMSVTPVAYAVFPEYFGTSLANISFGITIYSVGNCIMLFVAGEYLKKLGPRKSMIIGAFAVCAFGLTISFVPNLVGFFIAQTIAAFASSTCMNACCTMVIRNWFIEKQAKMIGICVAGGFFGGAFLQFIAGNLFEAVGCSKLYLVFGLSELVILLFLAVVVIREDPSVLGQKPLGWESAQPAAEDKPAAAAETTITGSIYKSPVFWMMTAACFFGTLVSASISNFSTTILPSRGIPLSTASTVVSIFGLAGGLSTFFVGSILAKLGLKKSMFAFAVSTIVANVLMYIWFGQPNWGLLVAAGATYAFGHPLTSISALVAGPVFGDKSYLAYPKLLAFTNAGHGILFPFLSRLGENSGFQYTYIVSIVMCCMFVFPMFAALKMSKNAVIR